MSVSYMGVLFLIFCGIAIPFAPVAAPFSHEKKKIMSYVTWMNLEDIVLNEISQSQKDGHSVILFICGIKLAKLIKTENRMVTSRYWVPSILKYCIVHVNIW